MAGIVVAPYPTDFVRGAPEPTNLGQPSGGAGSFGPTQPSSFRTIDRSGEGLQEAGASLDRASNNAADIALGMMKDYNETKAQDLNNQFITGQQKILYSGDDAFYKKQGKDAIDAAPVVTQQLQDLQKSIIDQAADVPALRNRITAITNGHIDSITNGMSRQVAAQTLTYTKDVLKAKEGNILSQARVDFDDSEKIKGLADGAETVAIAGLKAQGLYGDPEATKFAITAARSAVYAQQLDQLVQTGQSRKALAIYDGVKGQLDAKTNDMLSAKMKSVSTDLAATDIITKETVPASLGENVTKWAPYVYDAAQKHGVDPTLALAVLKQESNGNERAEGPATASGTAKGLMQITDGTAKALGMTDQYNGGQSIDKGVGYLADQMNTFKDQRLALMAYNWGPANVKNWLATGRDPSKIPAETVDYLQKVQGYQAAQTVGYQKADTEGLIQKIAADGNISPEVRQSAILKLRQQNSTTEAARKATKQNIDEGMAATTQMLILNPDAVPKGALAQFAEAYKGAGYASEAVTATLLASQENVIRNFAGSPKDAQEETMRSIIMGVLPEKAKAIAEGLRKDETKVRSDLDKQAHQEFEGLKAAADQAKEGKLDFSTMTDKAKAAVGMAVQAKNYPLAQEISNHYAANVMASAAGQLPPERQTQAQQEMRDTIEKGKTDNASILAAKAMDQTYKTQQAAFAADGFKTGTGLYKEVGAPVPINFNNLDPAALAMRAQQARQISQRQNGAPILPFDMDEIATLKNTLINSPSDTQAKILSGLSGLPADMIPRVAAALAGTKDTGDPASRAYAASMALFADAQADPSRAQVASGVLKGAELIRAGGASGLKPAVQSKDWQQEMQNQAGSAWADMKPSQQATLMDSIGAYYTYLMHRAGKQGDTTDTDVLGQAAKAVLGSTITKKGSSQPFYPPVRGMIAYDFENNVMARLTNGDLDGIKTGEGTQITADDVRGKAHLTSVGQGLYMVRISDPRRGGVPGELPLPNGQKNALGGNAWLLDANALMKRTPPEGASRDPNAPDYVNAPPVGPVSGEPR